MQDPSHRHPAAWKPRGDSRNILKSTVFGTARPYEPGRARPSADFRVEKLADDRRQFFFFPKSLLSPLTAASVAAAAPTLAARLVWGAVDVPVTLKPTAEKPSPRSLKAARSSRTPSFSSISWARAR